MTSPSQSEIVERRDWRRYNLKGFNSAADLRTLRKRAGLSRAELAGLIGCSPEAVKYWENQPGRIDGDVAHALRRALERLGIHVPVSGEPAAAEPAPMPVPKQCGAKTRSGHPCQCKPLPGKRRCKFHGGLSTGPRTQAGREAIARAQRERHRHEAHLSHGVLHIG